jgi:hypothetical protein
MFSKILFGFPLTTTHAFTTVERGKSYRDDGTVEDWLAHFARTQQLEPVPWPSVSEVGVRRLWPSLEQQDAYKAFKKRMLALLNRDFGGCRLWCAGHTDETPDWFVRAYEPELTPLTESCCPFWKVPALTVPPATDEHLRRFCALMGIEYQKPDWHLVHSWRWE